MEELIKKFNLPEYLGKSKSFSEASKMIMEKFEERKDNASKQTMNELMGRLREAQEFVKAKNEPPVPEQLQEPQDVMIEDDAMGMPPEEGIQQETEQGIPEGGGQTNQAALGGLFAGLKGKQGLGAGLGMANDLAGSLLPAVREDGVPDAGGSTLSGALSGASAGASLGPWGAVGGALVGGVSGLFGAKSAKKKFLNDQQNEVQGTRGAALNTFAEGGDMENLRLLRPQAKGVSPTAKGFDYDNSLPQISQSPAQGVERDSFIQRAGDTIGRMGTDAYNAVKPKVQQAGKYLQKNAGGIMRYAPAAMNAYQLANLEKPGYTSLNKLDGRYKPNYTDEQAIQNITREQHNNTAEALSGASGGSTSAVRANLLGAGLNRTRALGDAYMRGSTANRVEDRTGQQFNMNVDKANLGQSNLETDINARDQGAYNTEKSKLMAGLGNDVGTIGKEEKYKKMIEKVYGYNQKGEYLNKKKPRAKAIKAKARGMKVDKSLFKPLNLKNI